MSTKDDIRKNLNYYLTKFDVSQTDLAEKIGVSKQAVSNWKNGSNTIDIEKVPALCEYLGITMDQLFDGPRDANDGEARLLNIYRTVNADGKHLIEEIADSMSKNAKYMS